MKTHLSMTLPKPMNTPAREKHRTPNSAGSKRKSRSRSKKVPKPKSTLDDVISKREQHKETPFSTKSSKKTSSAKCSSKKEREKKVAFCSFTETFDEGYIIPRLNLLKGFLKSALKSSTQTKRHIETHKNVCFRVLDHTSPKMAIRTIKKPGARSSVDYPLLPKKRSPAAKPTHINSEKSIPRTQSEPGHVYKNVVQGQGPGNEDIVLIQKMGETEPSPKPRTIPQSLDKAPQSYPQTLVNPKVRAKNTKKTNHKPQSPPRSASPEPIPIPATISKQFMFEDALNTRLKSPGRAKVKLASEGVRYKGIRTIKATGQKSQK
ncbi:hypothetical protein OXX79_003306 [Metschnikowia pulcherrima]